MNSFAPLAAYFILTGMLCASLGFLIAVFFLSVRKQTIERDAWNQARVFFTRKQKERGL